MFTLEDGGAWIVLVTSASVSFFQINSFFVLDTHGGLYWSSTQLGCINRPPLLWKHVAFCFCKKHCKKHVPCDQFLDRSTLTNICWLKHLNLVVSVAASSYCITNHDTCLSQQEHKHWWILVKWQMREFQVFLKFWGYAVTLLLL